jgi:hypothetical protein
MASERKGRRIYDISEKVLGGCTPSGLVSSLGSVAHKISVRLGQVQECASSPWQLAPMWRRVLELAGNA